MTTYQIKPRGASKLGAALSRLCSPGQIGEPLVRAGATQSAVSLFAAKLALALADKGHNALQIAEVFDLASIANASALKQALADCELVIDDEAEFKAAGGKVLAEGKRVQLLVSAYWERNGGGRAAPNLAALDAVIASV